MDTAQFLAMYPEFAGFSPEEIAAKINLAPRHLGGSERWGDDYLNAYGLVVAHLLTVSFEDQARMAAISQQAAVGKVTPPQPLSGDGRDAFWRRTSYGVQFADMKGPAFLGFGIMAIY